MKTARRVVKEEVFPLKNHRKILAAVASIAAIASLTACGGVKDANTVSGSAITIGTTDKITSVDPAALTTMVRMPCRFRFSRSCMHRITIRPN